MMTVEICCGSILDAMMASSGGATRIELNSALAMGGLTPTTASVMEIKKRCPKLHIMAMVRPRGGGFCYEEEEFKLMLEEGRQLLAAGADGLVFGFLTARMEFDMPRMQAMTKQILQENKEAVVHRAFDLTKDMDQSMRALIDLGVHRVLTSGQQSTALEGVKNLRYLQDTYGSQIEILAGGGIRHHNMKEIVLGTGVSQVHSSCKQWVIEPTNHNHIVSYAYDASHPDEVEMVSSKEVRRMMKEASYL